eukprot:14214-Heterococcus_DN1.PRE.1
MLRWHENVNGAGGLWNTVVVGTIAGATDVIAVSLDKSGLPQIVVAVEAARKIIAFSVPVGADRSVGTNWSQRVLAAKTWKHPFSLAAVQASGLGTKDQSSGVCTQYSYGTEAVSCNWLLTQEQSCVALGRMNNSAISRS